MTCIFREVNDVMCLCKNDRHCITNIVYKIGIVTSCKNKPSVVGHLKVWIAQKKTCSALPGMHGTFEKVQDTSCPVQELIQEFVALHVKSGSRHGDISLDPSSECRGPSFYSWFQSGVWCGGPIIAATVFSWSFSLLLIFQMLSVGFCHGRSRAHA